MLALAACDLQPKIMSLPGDDVGDFIETRYPALLADPESQPEIYNSAASDYGVYASPELYGSATTDDYVLYASVDDYIIPPVVDLAPVVEIEKSSAPVIAVSDDDLIPTNDYLAIPEYGPIIRQDASEKKPPETVTVARGDTLYSLSKKYNTTVADLAAANNIVAPYNLRIGQKLKLSREPVNVGARSEQKTAPTPAPATALDVKDTPKTNTTTRVDLATVTVGAGDTLYSLSRKYSVPVNDLAVMNNLSAPFTLRAGQMLRVPNLATAPVRGAPTPAKANPQPEPKNAEKTPKAAPMYGTTKTPMPQVATKTTKTPTPQFVSKAQPSAVKSKPVDSQSKQKKTNKSSVNVKKTSDKKTDNKTQTSSQAQPEIKRSHEKISSDPTQKLPKIAARSSSKFSWPVRGKILSAYGAKSGGLFNDGINISAARGATVSAAENGVVAYAGNEVKGMGNLVIIQHSDGFMTVYAHLDAMNVRRGARVNVGQKIGTVGSTGKVTQPQLHFEIRKGTKAYDPQKQLKK